MDLSSVVLETPLILEKSAFTSTAMLYLRQDSRGECSKTVATSEDQFRPNYDRIKLKRLSVFNLSFCAICRSDIKYNNQRKDLKCEHAFHTKCIKQWLSMQNICPVCMVNLK